MTLQELIDCCTESVDKPVKMPGGALNPGTFFEVTVTLHQWYVFHRSPPKKKDIKGLDIYFDFYDIDEDEEKRMLGRIVDYKFVNDYRTSIRIMVENAKEL